MARPRRRKPKVDAFASLRLVHPLTLYKRGMTDGAYGATESEDVEVSGPHYAHIEPTSGGETDGDGQRQASAGFKVTTRYDAGFAVDRWFVHAETGARYDIEHIENVELRDEWAVIACRQVVVPEGV